MKNKKLDELPEEVIAKLKSGEDEMMESEKAAPFCMIKESYLFQLTSTRKIPHYKRGRKLIFLKSELIRWLLANRKATISELELEAEKHLAK